MGVEGIISLLDREIGWFENGSSECINVGVEDTRIWIRRRK